MRIPIRRAGRNRRVPRYAPPGTDQLVANEGKGATPARSAAAERMARMRARKAAAANIAPLMYERADWRLFVAPKSLPQRAGCEPYQLGRMILKELVDNAADICAPTGAVRIEPIEGGYRVADEGPGLDPDVVPRLFSVNRPLLSSKQRRVPLRGMLGNGLRVVTGAVAAFNGSIIVTTRGHRLTLSVNTVRGLTDVTSDEPVPPMPGMTVEIKLPLFNGSERQPAALTLQVAGMGRYYTGPSHPTWHDVSSLRELFLTVVPGTTPVATIIADVFGIEVADQRAAAGLSAEEVADLHRRLLRRRATPRAARVYRQRD